MKKAFAHFLCILIPVLCILYWEIAAMIGVLLILGGPFTIIVFFLIFGVPKYPRLPRRR